MLTGPGAEADPEWPGALLVVAADPHLFGVVMLAGAISTEHPCQQVSV